MFSGGNSSEDGVNSFNQINSFGLSAGSSRMPSSIDWAQLAQQWIQMRDSDGADIGGASIPDAPPPPNISGKYHQITNATSAKKSNLDEKGEADMDMDDDNDNCGIRPDKDRNSSPPPPPPSMQLPICGKVPAGIVQQPEWFVPQTAPLQPVIVPVDEGGVLNQQQQTATSWSIWPPPVTLPPPIVNVPVASVSTANPTAHIPSLLNITVPNPNDTSCSTDNSSSETTLAPLDAAKRKILPAWIREGLEKMERQKQRELEREQRHRISGDSRSDEILSNKLFPNKDMVNTINSQKVENDSSGNDSAMEGNKNMPGNIVGKESAAIATKHQQRTYCGDSDADTEKSSAGGKTFERRLAELMIVVRRSITELLLEVTNEEISNIANEVVKNHKSKASSAQVIEKSALSSITGKLGLAAYESSSDESSESETEIAEPDKGKDSEEEIKASIRQKRRNFAKISEEIDKAVEASSLREEQKLKYYSQMEQEKNVKKLNEKSRDDNDHRANEQYQHHRDVDHKICPSSKIRAHESSGAGKFYDRPQFGETTSETKFQNANGKRHKERSIRKERTSRFSDNKDGKTSSVAATASYVTQLQAVGSGSTSTRVSAVPVVSHAATTAPLFPVMDVNGMYTVTQTPGMNTILNAADVAFEKATKGGKLSSEKQKHHRNSRRKSSSDGSSDYTGSESNYSNCKYRKSGAHDRESDGKGRYYKKSKYDKERERDRDRYSRDREGSSYSSGSRYRRRYHHHRSSDSDDRDDDAYVASDRRKHSLRRKYSRSRSHSRSRSQSRSSHTSKRRKH